MNNYTITKVVKNYILIIFITLPYFYAQFKKLYVTIIALLLCYSLANAQTALEFNGTNNKVTTTIDADRQAMPRTTWSAWIKPHGTLTHWQMFVSMEDGGWDRFIAINLILMNLAWV